MSEQGDYGHEELPAPVNLKSEKDGATSDTGDRLDLERDTKPDLEKITADTTKLAAAKFKQELSNSTDEILEAKSDTDVIVVSNINSSEKLDTAKSEAALFKSATTKTEPALDEFEVIKSASDSNVKNEAIVDSKEILELSSSTIEICNLLSLASEAVEKVLYTIYHDENPTSATSIGEKELAAAVEKAESKLFEQVADWKLESEEIQVAEWQTESKMKDEQRPEVSIAAELQAAALLDKKAKGEVTDATKAADKEPESFTLPEKPEASPTEDDKPKAVKVSDENQVTPSSVSETPESTKSEYVKGPISNEKKATQLAEEKPKAWEEFAAEKSEPKAPVNATSDQVAEENLSPRKIEEAERRQKYKMVYEQKPAMSIAAELHAAVMRDKKAKREVTDATKAADKEPESFTLPEKPKASPNEDDKPKAVKVTDKKQVNPSSVNETPESTKSEDVKGPISNEKKATPLVEDKPKAWEEFATEMSESKAPVNATSEQVANEKLSPRKTEEAEKRRKFKMVNEQYPEMSIAAEVRAAVMRAKKAKSEVTDATKAADKEPESFTLPEKPKASSTEDDKPKAVKVTDEKQVTPSSVSETPESTKSEDLKRLISNEKKTTPLAEEKPKAWEEFTSEKSESKAPVNATSEQVADEELSPRKIEEAERRRKFKMVYEQKPEMSIAAELHAAVMRDKKAKSEVTDATKAADKEPESFILTEKPKASPTEDDKPKAVQVTDEKQVTPSSVSETPESTKSEDVKGPISNEKKATPLVEEKQKSWEEFAAEKSESKAPVNATSEQVANEKLSPRKTEEAEKRRKFKMVYEQYPEMSIAAEVHAAVMRAKKAKREVTDATKAADKEPESFTLPEEPKASPTEDDKPEAVQVTGEKQGTTSSVSETPESTKSEYVKGPVSNEKKATPLAEEKPKAWEEFAAGKSESKAPVNAKSEQVADEELSPRQIEEAERRRKFKMVYEQKPEMSIAAELHAAMMRDKKAKREVTDATKAADKEPESSNSNKSNERQAVLRDKKAKSEVTDATKAVDKEPESSYSNKSNERQDSSPGDSQKSELSSLEEKPEASPTEADDKPKAVEVSDEKQVTTSSVSATPESTESEDVKKGPISNEQKATSLAENNPKEDEKFWDILGNGTLLKKVLEGGTGKIPNMGDAVVVDISYEIPELGKVLPNKRLEYVLGDGDDVQALDLAVALMQVGEKAIVIAGYKYMYGELGDKPDIPAMSNFKLTVRLLENKGPVDYQKMDFKTRFAEAKKKNDVGNYRFRRNEYSFALRAYSKATMIVDPAPGCDFPDESPKNLQQLLELRAIFLCNTSATQYKLEAFDKAVISAREATALCPAYDKAYVRLAQAYEKMGNPEGAIRSYKNALKHESSNMKMLHAELERLTKAHKKTRKNQQDMYSKMFWDLEPSSVPEKPPSPKNGSASSWIWKTGMTVVGAGLVGLAGFGIYKWLKS